MSDVNTIPLQIAIDGPVAAGKGDIAARLAKELHLIFINTGAMYRMLALACIRNQIERKDESKVMNVLDRINIDLQPSTKESEKTYVAILDGTDVTDRLLDPDVSIGSSDVATIPSVRKKMVELQQKMVIGKRVVMEGRDIGLRVLPNSQLKIFLTASPEERAKRRQEQWQEKGIDKTFQEVFEETKLRDKQDSERATDPLQILPDAWKLDTTSLTQEQVVQKIIDELKKRKLS